MRIWPLYFLTIIIYKIILPLLYEDYNLIVRSLDQNNEVFKSIVTISHTTEWLLIIFLLPQVLLAFGKVFFPAFLWSIGVEELFYVVWPHVINTKKFIKTISVILAIYLILYYTASYIWLFSNSQNNLLNKISQFTSVFLYMQRISCMIIGGVFAYIYLFKRDTFFHKRVSLLYYLGISIISLILLLGIYLPFFVNEIIALSISFIIFYLSVNNKNNVLNKVIFNKVTNVLGKYSYGIYMYHTLAIICAIEVCSNSNIDKRLFIYLFSVIFTLLFSYLSYNIFEKFFLKFKKRAL